MSVLNRPVIAPSVAERAPSRRPAVLAGLGALCGLALAVVWSFEFVDSTIGDNVANTVLGYDAKQVAITSVTSGIAFAFVSGLAGTFTACNIAVFGALPQVTGTDPAARAGASSGPGRAMAWLIAGMLSVSMVYGILAVLLGGRLPQLSTAVLGSGMPVRFVQSSVVFGLIGLAFVAIGLGAMKLIPDVFAHRPTARLVVMGALIGGFLIGRPYPLFRKLLDYAVVESNPLYGALAMVLQSLGNVVVVAVLAAVLTLVTRTRAVRGLARPERLAWVSGVVLVALGTFLVVYWDVRLPAMFGLGWFPKMPWN